MCMSSVDATRCSIVIRATRRRCFLVLPSPGLPMEMTHTAHLSLILWNCSTSCLERRMTVVTKPDRIQIEYDLKFKTPFHCGTGIRVGLIDRTIIRDNGGYLY